MRNSASNSVEGWDGDGTNNNVIDAFHACNFVDGSRVRGANQGDTAPGFYLLNWQGSFDSTGMVCILTIEG